MIGPTGVGKTEIARRLARLAKAPFIKVEATKFTEVGYVGREVDSIVRDLVEISVKMTREEEMAKVRHRAADAAEDRVLDMLLPRAQAGFTADAAPRDNDTRQRFRKMLREGQLDDREIEIEVRAVPDGRGNHGAPRHGGNDAAAAGHVPKLGRRPHAAAQAQDQGSTEAAGRRRSGEDDQRGGTEGCAPSRTPSRTASCSSTRSTRSRAARKPPGADVSREGVQRDLLPLVEGCTVNTKYGTVKTDHVLFIASGAFHMSKPSDLIPELQGRLPIRVELEPLVVEDFVRILTEPDASLVPPVHGAARHRRRGPGIRRLRRAAARRSGIRGQ